MEVQVHLFTLIQLQYNNNKKKKEVNTKLTTRIKTPQKGPLKNICPRGLFSEFYGMSIPKGWCKG